MTEITEAAVLAALRTVQEPELGGDLVTRNMVRDLAIDGTAIAFTIELTTPACPLKDQIETEVRRALDAAGHRRRSTLAWGATVRRAAPRTAEQLLPGRQERHRRRVGQGRRRQEHGLGQPRRRARPCGRARRPPRRGHHGAQHPDDARPRGPAAGERRAARSSRSSATA